MGKQLFNIRGMMRDLDPAKFPNQYAYEIRNLRLTAQEDSTLLALTTEKGNSQYTLSNNILGDVVGYCVLNKYITLFTCEMVEGVHVSDHIYRLENSEELSMSVVTLYNGNLGFTENTRMETLGVYENEDIQKVYWIDGVHQPRVINIKDTTTDYTSKATPFDFIPVLSNAEKVSIQKLPYTGNFAAGTIQYILTYYNKNGQQSNAFYVSPLFYVSSGSRGSSPEETVSTAFQISVSNPSHEFDFIRIYSVQRTSRNGTPICKKVSDLRISSNASFQVSSKERRAAVGSFSANTFTNIDINSIDNIMLFTGISSLKDTEAKPMSDYLISASGNIRTYHIPSSLYLHYFSDVVYPSTSLMTDYVYHSNEGFTFTIDTNLMKLNTPGSIRFLRTPYSETSSMENVLGVTFVDNGLNNETVDYSEILYAGGTAIVPNTFEQKNNTLFFGNYSYKLMPVTQEQITTMTEGVTVTFAHAGKAISKGEVGSYYMYQSQFDDNEKNITTFKGGESYRFGFILYNALGEKTSVIDIGEYTNDYYPQDFDTEFFPVKAYINFPLANINYMQSLGYTSIQCVVKENQNYKVVAQGALCPTLYKMKDRKSGNMFSVSSWFFRDLQLNTREDYINPMSHEVVSRRNSRETLYWRRKPDQGTYEYSTNPSDPSLWNVATEIVHNHRIRGTQNVHNQNISSFIDREFISQSYGWQWSLMPDSEIMGTAENDASAYDPRELYTDRDFFIDWGTITMHSPEFEFEDISDLPSNYNLRIVGLLPITGVRTRHILETESGSVPYHIGIENFKENPVIFTNIQQSGYETALSDYSWTDGKEDFESAFFVYPVLPWQRNASLSGEQVSIDDSENWRGLLGYNIRSSIRTSAKTLFIGQHEYPVSKALIYHDDAKVLNLGIDSNMPIFTANRLYSGEVQDVLTDPNTYNIHYPYNGNEVTVSGHRAPITVKYKSKPHAVFALDYNNEEKQVILPSLDFGNNETAGEMPTSTIYPLWQTPGVDLNADGVISQEQLDVSDIQASYKGYGFVYLAELVQQNKEVIKEGIWNVGGLIQTLTNDRLAVEVSYGDTYYQRYDCLKTYPYSPEDQNQIIEILSFMCETRLNIDGRYDSRRGQADNTTVNNTNFNLLNKAYTQNNNFITYSYLDIEDYDINDFPNQLIWTKTKVYGSDVDNWTQLIPTSILDMSGNLGEIQALRLWNDNLMCFQDKGIARIMYNERTTMTTQQGVPIEIANSGKVDGSTYISNQIGCSNKDSIQVTQDGVYFIDSDTKEIYRWSKGIEPISKGKGFNTYLYNNPYIDTEKTFYDPKLKDVYFQFGDECLVYNEQLAEFTSFMDYNMKFMFPFKKSLIAIKDNDVWKQFAGDYLSFFNEDKGYSVDVIASEQPTEDKIFSTVEFRAEVLDDSIQNPYSQETSSSLNVIPFTKIRAWNEYQDTDEVDFERVLRRGNGTNLAQKFRIWRGDIPRVKGKPLERIRNPWTRIKLSDDGDNKKTVIHDIAVTYF